MSQRSHKRERSMLFTTTIPDRVLQIDLNELIIECEKDYRNYLATHAPDKKKLYSEFLSPNKISTLRQKAKAKINPWQKLFLREFTDSARGETFEQLEFEISKLDIFEAEIKLRIYAVEEEKITNLPHYIEMTQSFNTLTAERTQLQQRNREIGNMFQPTHDDRTENWNNVRRIRNIEHSLYLQKSLWNTFTENTGFNELQQAKSKAHHALSQSYTRLAALYYQTRAYKKMLEKETKKTERPFPIPPNVHEHIVMLQAEHGMHILLQKTAALKQAAEEITNPQEKIKCYEQLVICHKALANKILIQDIGSGANAQCVLQHVQHAQEANAKKYKLIQQQPHAIRVWLRGLWGNLHNKPTHQLLKSLRNNFNAKRFMRTLQALYDESHSLTSFAIQLKTTIYNDLTTEELLDLHKKLNRQAVANLRIGLRLAAANPGSLKINPEKKTAFQTMTQLINTLSSTLTTHLQERLTLLERPENVTKHRVEPNHNGISFFNRRAMRKHASLGTIEINTVKKGKCNLSTI